MHAQVTAGNVADDEIVALLRADVRRTRPVRNVGTRASRTAHGAAMR